MSVEEQNLVEEREQLLDEVVAFVAEHHAQTLYPSDIVAAFQGQGKSERVITSAVWRLIDQHRIDLNKQLAVVLVSSGV